MATYEDYQKVIGGLDAAKGAAEKINEFSENARALEKAAKAAEKAGDTFEKLNQAQELMKGVEVFGKLATGLGMAAMGLELALSVFGPEAPDPTELILGAIDKLDNKVDGLWASMDKKFDEVLGKVDQVAADIMISEELENFAVLQDVVSGYIKNRSKSNIQTLLDPRYDPDGIYADLVKIADYLKPDSQYNPLEKTYNATNGDLRAVMKLGNKFQKITQLAPMAYGLISAFHFEKSGPDYVLDSAADIEDKFKEHIVNINARVDFYIEKCRKELIPNSLADAQSMMKDLKTTGDWHEGSNYRQAAKDLWEKLAPKYFWLDWFVVVGCGDIFGKKLKITQVPIDNERGSHFFNNAKCNKTTETMTILIGWRSRDIKSQGKTYFFRGTEYSRYDILTNKAEPGYPRPIAGNWPGLWADGITAAFNWNHEKAYFFRGSEYIRYDIAADKADPGYPRPIAEGWPGLWADEITAAENWRGRRVIFFRGSEYMLYNMDEYKADPGYPRPIAKDLRGLWADEITKVVQFDNWKSYFFRGSEYIRYDMLDNKAAPGYPRPIAGDWPDLWAMEKTAVFNLGPTQKQLDYKILFNYSDRPQMIIDSAHKYGLEEGVLAWLCNDNVPFSAYWNPENDINVVVACSHPQMFPTKVMDGLKGKQSQNGRPYILVMVLLIHAPPNLHKKKKPMAENEAGYFIQYIFQDLRVLKELGGLTLI